MFYRNDCYLSTKCVNVQAYANNQHKIAEEMLTNPFLKAMSICEGTVSILDAGCVVYSRIWCIFELFKSVMGGNSNYEFDVYTEINGDKAVGITHGYIPRDYGTSVLKDLRESAFPLDKILQAVNVDIKQAQASVESDRRFILNTITGQSVDDAVVDDHANYDELNNILRGILIAPALESIIKERDVDTIFRCLEIVKASNARVIILYLRHCSRFDDSILIRLADSLPPSLTEFSLVSNGSSSTVNGMNTSLRKLLRYPHLVSLNLYGNNIDDDGARYIADALKVNHSLEELNLRDNKISADGAKQIAYALKVNHSLKSLNLGNNKIGDEGAKQIADALKDNHSLEELNLSENKIGANVAKQIADALKVNHSLKTWNLYGNNIGDEGAKQIADALKFNHSLKTLVMIKNNVSADGKKYLSKIMQELKDAHSYIDIRWL